MRNGIKLNEADCHLSLRLVNGYNASTLSSSSVADLELLCPCLILSSSKCLSFTLTRGGARATLGVHTGFVAFEVTLRNLGSGGQVRVGYSTAASSLHLGQDAFSFGYQSNGRVIHNRKEEPYGESFGVGDTIGCFFSSSQRVFGFTKNGVFLGTAFSTPEQLSASAFFPHVCIKNAVITVNFGQHERAFPPSLHAFSFIDRAPLENFIAGPEMSSSKPRSVTLLVGLPYAGKTTWAKKQMTSNFDESPALVSVEEVLEQMNVGTLLQRRSCDPEELRYKLEKAPVLVSVLTSIASKSQRHILIESNSTIDAAGRKPLLNFFPNFEKRAVVFLPNPMTIQQRSAIASAAEGKALSPDFVLEQQEKIELPSAAEGFTLVSFADCLDPDQMCLRYKITAKEIRAGLRSPPTQVFRVKTNLPNRTPSFEDIRQTLTFSTSQPFFHTSKGSDFHSSVASAVLKADAPTFQPSIANPTAFHGANPSPMKFVGTQPFRARSSPKVFRYEPYSSRNLFDSSNTSASFVKPAPPSAPLPSPFDLARNYQLTEKAPSFTPSYTANNTGTYYPSYPQSQGFGNPEPSGTVYYPQPQHENYNPQAGFAAQRHTFAPQAMQASSYPLYAVNY